MQGEGGKREVEEGGRWRKIELGREERDLRRRREVSVGGEGCRKEEGVAKRQSEGKNEVGEGRAMIGSRTLVGETNGRKGRASSTSRIPSR